MMKLSRIGLIKRAENAIRDRDDRYAADLKIYTEALRGAEIQYVARYSQDWSDFASNIDDAVQAQRPVMRDMMPDALARGGSAPEFYSPWWASGNTDIPNKPVRPDPSDLRSLINFLTAVTDDEVTTAGLERAGFRNIAALFGGS